jgi:hypothetical protein
MLTLSFKAPGIRSLRLLGQACVGVVAGALLAMAVARLAWPPSGYPNELPTEILPSQAGQLFFKPREIGFYLLTLVFGTAGGYFATFKVIGGTRASYIIWSSLLCSVLFADPIITATLGDSYGTWIVAIPLGTAAVAVGLFGFFLFCFGQPLDILTDDRPDDKPSKDTVPLWVLAILTCVVLPSSFLTVAVRIGLNFHAVSFAFGPALYFLDQNLLPGIDYYAQYSIGYPWLLHFVMGQSVERTITIYAVTVILATWLFYAHLIYLLRDLYKSWIAAALVSLIPLILGFLYQPSLPGPLLAPSSTVLRYPLLIVCTALVGHWAAKPKSLARILAVAVAAGFSIFLETESGIIIAFAAIGTLLLVYPWQIKIVIPLIAFAVLSLVVFVLLISLAFGGNAMKVAFFIGLLDGFLNVGVRGFGAVPATWTLSDWNWLYNFVAPGVMIATLAVTARACGRSNVDRKRSAILAFLAASGLMLLVKYANRSLIGVWHSSAVGPFAILGWWCVVIVRRIDQSTLRRRISLSDGRVRLRFVFSIRNATAVTMVVLVFVYLRWPTETSNSASYYGLEGWSGYPSLLRWPFSTPGGCIRMDCLSDLPAASDVALVEKRTQPGEPVFIFSLYDWAYLVDAHRPPQSPFLPSPFIFTNDQLNALVNGLRKQDYVFTARDAKDQPTFYWRDDIARAILPILDAEFKRDGEGEKLIAWKRIDAKSRTN